MVMYMGEVVEQVKSAGIRDKVKIMVGGAVLNEEYAEQIGADFYGKDAMASVRYAKEICS